tara:strand:- start:449 stop:2995 length:2547 start_codon:yes stop_codon:yes gene_type:complete
MTEMLKNPFIIKNSKYTFDDETFEFTNRNLRTHFKKVYIFCKFNNNIDYQKILEGNIDYQEFKNITKMFTLYESNISLIYNEVLKPNIIIMDSELIKDSNYFGYNLPDKILILPIFNISFLHIQNHIDNITENINTFEKFYNEIIIKDNLKYNFSNREINNILKIIENLQIDEYWKIYRNCNININKYFNSRMFEFVPIKDKKSGIIASAMTKINKSADYFNELLDKKINKMMVNEEESTFNNKYFYSKDGSGFTNDEINSVFEFFKNKLDKFIIDNDISNIKQIKKLIFTLFLKLFKSKDFCHHILNNKYMLNILNTDLFSSFSSSNKQKIEFISNFKYAWTRFYMDEREKEGYLNTDDEIVFDINTASKLPYFGENSNNLNPYIAIPINQKSLKNNIYGLEHTAYIHKNNYLGIVELEKFKNNMNTFISGSGVFDIFNGIDFKQNKMAVTGSIMPACLQKNNPLRMKFDNDYRYYSEYYCDSDIDVMIKTNEINEFLNITQNIFKKMTDNIKTYFEYLFLDINYNKNIYVYLTKNFIDNNLSEHDYDYVKNNINSDEIIEKILPFIIKEHDKYLESLNLDEDKLDLVKEFDKSKVNIILYDHEKENYDDITIRFNIKARIKSKYLCRELELFMISGNDFMNVVSKFHLPCVRAYYNGDNVYMTPSCITSYMTMINMHYTYFSSATTPMEIINKYRMRGFGIILNKKEITELFKYSCDTEYWRNLYGFKNVENLNFNMNKFIGYKPIYAPFFQPRKTNFAYYLDNDYVEDTYELIHIKKNPNYIIYMFGISTINFNQNINELSKCYYSHNNGNLKPMNNNNFNDMILEILSFINNSELPLNHNEWQS